MSMQQFSNNFATVLSSGVLSSDTVLPLSSVAGLPSLTGNAFYKLTLIGKTGGQETNWEIVKVSAAPSGNSITVQRAQEGTPAQDWAAGTPVELRLTAGTLVSLTDHTNDILSEARHYGTPGSAKTEYQSVAASGVQTILDVTGCGYVNSLFIAIYATDYLSRERSLIRIYVDDEATPSVSISLSNFFASEYCGGATSKSFSSRFFGFQHQSANNIGYRCFIPIPFSTRLKIEIENGSAASAMTLWSVTQYSLGVPNDWPRTRKLRAVEGRVSNIAPDTVTTLVDISGLKGRLLGIAMLIDSGSSTWAPLEGNVTITCDGAPSLIASGTEDYFLQAFYFEGGERVSDYVGCTIKDTAGYAVGAYRLHIPDPQIFDGSLKIQWQNGDTSQVSFVSNTYLSYCVWYYTE